MKRAVVIAIGLAVPLAAFQACGDDSSGSVAAPDGGGNDSSVRDGAASDAPLADVVPVVPFDSGGVVPCDKQVQLPENCTIGSQVCCYGGAAGTGNCVDIASSGVPLCTANSNEFDCAATGDCTGSNVCCAKLAASQPSDGGFTGYWSSCQPTCTLDSTLNEVDVLCNGPSDTTSCAKGKTCAATTILGFPAGYYVCN